ncbi:MAG: hypothetical protein JSS66_17785 [Armatimonadetes bacterium]|nr:hypothetical protein [Armatimonadota bacterium]
MVFAPLACSLALMQGQTPARDAILDDLSRRAFRFFVEQSDSKTGFTLDRARNQGPNAPEYVVASIATTGFALSAYAVGAQRGWIPKEKAVDLALNTLRHVRSQAPSEHGWYYHWLHWKTGERQWNSEVSTIDTGIFLCGLIVAEQGLKDKRVTKEAEEILKAVDWKWALTNGGAKPDERFISHGWRPEEGFIQWRWADYCELLLLYVLAYGSYPDMPADSWSKIGKHETSYKGLDFFAGGPLFFHQMSHVFVDFKGKRDPDGFDFWVAGRNAVLANKQYCVDNPNRFKGYTKTTWGLSASDGPDGYRAYGAPGYIDDDGTMAPSSAVGCAMYDKGIAIDAAEGFRAAYPWSLGKYGFVISLNPTKDWHSPDVIGIDLGQMMLSVENSKDNLVHKLFMSHPIAKRGMKRIGFRATKEGDATKRPLRLLPR